jgi:hypothetical protein
MPSKIVEKETVVRGEFAASVLDQPCVLEFQRYSDDELQIIARDGSSCDLVTFDVPLNKAQEFFAAAVRLCDRLLKQKTKK